MFAKVYTTLFIKIGLLVLHVEFDLYYSIITFTESITDVHTGLHRCCYLVCTEFTCRRHSSVEVWDCLEELGGRKVLSHIVVPCILKARFQLCVDT